MVHQISKSSRSCNYGYYSNQFVGRLVLPLSRQLIVIVKCEFQREKEWNVNQFNYCEWTYWIKQTWTVAIIEFVDAHWRCVHLPLKLNQLRNHGMTSQSTLHITNVFTNMSFDKQLAIRLIFSNFELSKLLRRVPGIQWD